MFSGQKWNIPIKFMQEITKWTPSSEFVSSSIPSWQILTAHAQPFRGARDLAFCLKVPLDSLLVWASSGGSGETARMRRLAWTFAARIGNKYQIRLTPSKWKDTQIHEQNILYYRVIADICEYCPSLWASIDIPTRDNIHDISVITLLLSSYKYFEPSAVVCNLKNEFFYSVRVRFCPNVWQFFAQHYGRSTSSNTTSCDAICKSIRVSVPMSSKCSDIKCCWHTCSSAFIAYF